ncbi:MAG: hypothetical protein HETSPECPRED_001225 [Heterodermia speciosa]|uniref:C2H2-type domain-containing protein n=1 Tax=Heterodermia speciosa TaxID=116794 RepID=A0A8H3IC14_9LECA|nr:MAG: hypothetical protein HETSPECPRED_001225 [Heterodermia speciosa]
MGKPKRKHPDLEEILARPWCYYCERDFDDLKILINHQKAKHFKCERCGRRLNTAGGLSVHMTQVHKESLASIENALPNRAGLDVEIFGMEGIPEDIVTAHQQRVIGQFAQAEAERRAATGNAGPGASGAGAVKKPKFESPSDLKKRLAEHKAKKAAEQAAGISSGDATPIGAGYGGQSPGQGQNSNVFNQGSPGYQQGQMQYGPPPNTATYPSFQQPYGQQPGSFQQQPPNFTQQQQPGSFSQAPPGFGSPGMPPQFPNSQQYGPPHQFNQQGPGFSPPFQNGPPRPFNSASPPPFQQNQFQPPRTHTPPQNGIPSRPTNLPPAPGLPQRPSVSAPPVNAFQMQQLHQGQILASSNPSDAQIVAQDLTEQPAQPTASSADASAIDDLISGVTNNVNNVEAAPADRKEEKKAAKKDKDKSTKLIYSDNDISPEEKMAQLPRYAYVPSAN